MENWGDAAGDLGLPRDSRGFVQPAIAADKQVRVAHLLAAEFDVSHSGTIPPLVSSRLNCRQRPCDTPSSSPEPLSHALAQVKSPSLRRLRLRCGRIQLLCGGGAPAILFVRASVPGFSAASGIHRPLARGRVLCPLRRWASISRQGARERGRPEALPRAASSSLDFGSHRHPGMPSRRAGRSRKGPRGLAPLAPRFHGHTRLDEAMDALCRRQTLGFVVGLR